MNIVIENKGIKTDSFYVPPFVLREGEVVVLFLNNRDYYNDTEMFLKDIFCGKIKHENVILHRKMKYVDYFRRSYFRDNFFPLTVERYLKKNADLKSPFPNRIYEDKWIKKETKIENLEGTQRKLLTLYATLSKTKNIVFDLPALDWEGTEFAFKMVTDAVKDGGSAILLDGIENMKEYAAKFIELEWNKDKLPPIKEFKIKF